MKAWACARRRSPTCKPPSTRGPAAKRCASRCGGSAHRRGPRCRARSDRTPRKEEEQTRSKPSRVNSRHCEAPLGAEDNFTKIVPILETKYRELSVTVRLMATHMRGARPMRLLTHFLSDQSGATAIEYGVIAAGIAVAIIAVVNSLGSQLQTTFSTVSSQLATAGK